MKRKKAFTLAEILITLVILGIIASITVPVIMNQAELMQSKTGNKVAFSILSSALIEVKQSNGGTFLNMTNEYLRTFLVNQSNHTTQWSFTNWHKDYEWFHMNGMPRVASGWGGVKNTNGMIISAFIQNQQCEETMYGYPKGQTTCGFLYADINGIKKPNTVGKDIFLYWILSNGFVPAGTDGDYYSNTCNSSSSGWGCAAKYLRE